MCERRCVLNDCPALAAEKVKGEERVGLGLETSEREQHTASHIGADPYASHVGADPY